MVLEAVMIVVDNSESSRNGDYTPNRYDAQSDAVNIIFQNVVQGNPESSVGLMSMGGKGPEVLATLTTDQGKILEGLHQTKKKIRGSAHVSTGIQIASVSCNAESSVCAGIESHADFFHPPARPQTPPEQVPAGAHHRLRVLAD
jgi:hypothetical protein